MTRALLVDLDDTLYAYAPADAAGRAAVLPSVAAALACAEPEAAARYAAARDAVKHRVGRRGCSHARLLYLHELVAEAGRPDLLGHVRAWERAYWAAFLGAARLADGAAALLDAVRERGWRVSIITDLTLEVQLWKCEALGLLSRIDALTASEEVEADKPHPALFHLGAARVGVPLARCVVLGDDDARDGEGARALGLPFFLAGRGADLARAARDILELDSC
jgi:FMN phosphatase YigB (HAD superfamily)